MVNETLGERIFRTLKEEILSGYYSPGDRLLYEKVAERLGVSMTPLKDALLRLEQEGLVKNIARKGTFVSRLDQQDVIEYCQIRFALESLAVDLICSHNLFKEEHFASLKEINEQIKTAIDHNEQKDCIIHDIKFHLEIVRISGNDRLLEILNQFPLSNLLFYMGKGEKSIESGDMILADHDCIIQSLKTREFTKIKKVLERNIFFLHNQLFVKEDKEAMS